jgi:hypothetical protein
MKAIALWGAGLALVAHAPPAAAQPKDLSPEALAEHLAEIGTWSFAARAKGPDGKPECVETWHFDADGTGWVHSGEQHVTLSWRTEAGESTDRWLYRTSLTSTDGPDCMGNIADPADYPSQERGFVVMFFNYGGALTCRPAAYVMRNGEITGERILRDEDCWGSLNPVKSQ